MHGPLARRLCRIRDFRYFKAIQLVTADIYGSKPPSRDSIHQTASRLKHIILFFLSYLALLFQFDFNRRIPDYSRLVSLIKNI